MNDFIYVPVGKDEFDEIMKSGDAINLVGGRDLKGEPRWLKKVQVSEYLKSISPIQEDWKEKLRAAAKNYSELFYQDGIGIMGASYADFVKGAEWAKQYIEENIKVTKQKNGKVYTTRFKYW